jgi:hypothetical protein
MKARFEDLAPARFFKTAWEHTLEVYYVVHSRKLARFVLDSPLEERRFEPLVPPYAERLDVKRLSTASLKPGLTFCPKTKFATDSPLEQTGFEPLVPLVRSGSVSRQLAARKV